MSAEPVKETRATETAAPAPDTALDAKPETTGETTAPVTTEAPKEEKISSDAVKVEAQPIAAGNLGYKAPGLLKSLRFSQKYFWFGDEALDESTISTYLKTEKAEHKNHNAAHASQTGKGLLLFAKREEDKSAPQGILNLSEASEVTKEGILDFSFKLHGHKHTFQTSKSPERDSWIVAVEKAVAEAKASKDGIVNSDGYKSQLNKFSKPAIGAAGGVAATKAVSAPKAEDKVHDGNAEGTTTTAASSEPAKNEKSRSQSRKRGSIFGKYLAKKDEAEEKIEAAHEKKNIKKEEKEAEKEEKQADKEESKEEKKEEEGTAVAAGTAAGAAVAAEESKQKGDESKPEATSPTGPSTLKSKRGSVFGAIPFLNKKEKEAPVKTEEEIKPAVPAKDTEPVSETAPQLANPVEGTGTAEPSATADPVADSEPVTTTNAKGASSPSPKADKSESKGGLFGFLKQKEQQLEVKKEEKKEAKEEKHEDKAEDKEGKEVEKSAQVAPAEKTATTPAAETTPTKDKRRSSFFGTLGKKDKKVAEPKEKKSENAVSDAEGTDNEKKANKLQGLFRRASKSAKPTKEPVTDSAAPPVPSKDTEAPTEKSETQAANPDAPSSVTAEAPSTDSPEATAPTTTAPPVAASA